MKNILLLVIICGLFSCGSASDNETQSTTEGNQAKKNNQIVTNGSSSRDDDHSATGSSRIVSRFLRDITSIESDASANPIEAFSNDAKDQASEVIELHKANAASIFKQAEEYQHCIIVAGDHTIVKITNFVDCKDSGSWGTCMPQAKGYIKKGELQLKEDYVNNIIGRPDSGKQTVFLFK